MAHEEKQDIALTQAAEEEVEVESEAEVENIDINPRATKYAKTESEEAVQSFLCNLGCKTHEDDDWMQFGSNDNDAKPKKRTGGCIVIQ